MYASAFNRSHTGYSYCWARTNKTQCDQTSLETIDRRRTLRWLIYVLVSDIIREFEIFSRLDAPEVVAEHLSCPAQ